MKLILVDKRFDLVERLRKKLPPELGYILCKIEANDFLKKTGFVTLLHPASNPKAV